MARISENEIYYLGGLVNQNAQEALNLLLTYEQEYADDINFRRNRGAFLIDIGSALEDSALVQRGIESIRQLLPNIEAESRPMLLYNLGNGYVALHFIARRQPVFSFNPDTTPLVEAKRCYREALQGAEYLDANLRAELRVNYGNCLSHIGRSVEAIAEYNAALTDAPNHPMAWGNLGIELEHFAFVAGYLTLLREANEALNKALADNRLKVYPIVWTKKQSI